MVIAASRPSPWSAYLLDLAFRVQATADGYFCWRRSRHNFLLALVSCRFTRWRTATSIQRAHGCSTSCCCWIAPALVLLRPCRVRFRVAAESFSLRKLAHPLAGWLAGVGAMWLWHAPALCNAAVDFQAGVCLANAFAAGAGRRLLVAGPRAARGGAATSPPGTAVVYLASTHGMHGVFSVLGIDPRLSRR